MSLVRDSIAGTLAAARSARATTSTTAGIGSVKGFNWSAIGQTIQHVSYGASIFRETQSQLRTASAVSSPKPRLRFVRSENHREADVDDDLPAPPDRGLTRPARDCAEKSTGNATSTTKNEGRTNWIAASKYTGTKKWSRRLQRQRIVQLPYKLDQAKNAARDPKAEVLWQTATPSEILVSSLRATGHTVKLHKQVNVKKRDFSWLHPSKLRPEKSIFWSSKARRKDLILKLPHLRIMKNPPRLSYATIVAAYIRKVDLLLRCKTGVDDDERPGSNDEHFSKLETALLDVFNDKTMKYLSDRGYSPIDVVKWAWILTAESPLQSAKRYDALERDRLNQLQQSVSQLPNKQQLLPPFILLLILRQENVCADALQYLIIHTSNLLQHAAAQFKAEERSKLSNIKTPWNPFINSDSVMMFIIRLIRASRAVWPSAFLSSAHIFTSILGQKSLNEYYGPNLHRDLQRRLVLQYNKILNLISLPCNINPFHSNAVQQRAQFHLLREMTKFDPPLIVNRMGFQAITRVQIAHAKTESERDWAMAQLKSWPPWKEARLGIDPIKGEGSESRAARAIGYMISAGYSLSIFDQTARIVAGWDTDMTPTVQTRTVSRRASTFELKHGLANPRVWAARIRATRTLKEAWACFLSYEDSGAKAHNDVYFAMAEKIVFHGKTLDEPKRLDTAALPGDMKEVVPEPRSPRDVTYTRTEPPTLSELLMHKMLAHNVRLSGRFLCLVLENAHSIEFGLHFLEQSQLPEKWKQALLLIRPGKSPKQTLEEIPNYIFCAFVRFLCRFADVRTSDMADVDLRSRQAWCMVFSTQSIDPELTLFPNVSSPAGILDSKEHIAEQVDHSMAFAHALQLVRIRSSQYPPVSHIVLETLTGDRFDPEAHRSPLSHQRVESFWDITECLNFMETQGILVDMKALKHVCTALDKLIVISRFNSTGVSRGVSMSRYMRAAMRGQWSLDYMSANDMIKVGVGMIKKYFDNLMLSSAKAFDLSPPSTAGNKMHPAALITDPDVASTLPLMIQVPPPHLIHMLIRTFGLAEDIQGLLLLTSWLRKFEPEVTAAVEERAGGRKQMRYAVCALRVFLEERWDSWDPVFENRRTERSQERRHTELTVWEEIRNIVEETPVLAPWPDDDEVEAYILRRRIGE